MSGIAVSGATWHLSIVFVRADEYRMERGNIPVEYHLENIFLDP